MANERAEIEIVVNGGQAKQSLNDIAKAVDGVAVSADNAGASMSKVGDEVKIEKVSGKVKSLRDNIIRQTDAVIAQARAYDEVGKAQQLIERKGVSFGDVAGQVAALKAARSELDGVLASQKAIAEAKAENDHWNALNAQRITENKRIELEAIRAGKEAKAALQAQDERMFKVNAVLVAEKKRIELEAIRAIQAENAHYEQLKNQWAANEAKRVAKETADLKAYQNSVKSAALELEATGKTASERAAIRGKIFGIPQDEINRQVAGLKAIEQQIAKTNPRFNEMGLTAKGTAAALRQVPAQFTDIIVSLQGGQAPLTVLLQQGGQLKDVFGGVGNAFKALSGYIIGLINPFTLLAAAAGTVGFAYFKGSQELDAYNKALVMSGNAIGATTGQLKSMAQVASKTTGATIGATSDAVAQLAASGKVATQNMAQFAGLAVKLQREAGIAVGDTVKAFADLAKDPVSASEKLNESTRYLTAEIYNQIKALKDQGDNLGAAALAQRAYSDAMNDRLPDLTQNLGLVEKAWRGIVGSAKSAWDAMLGVGRADTATDKINLLRERIADTQKNLAYNPGLFGADLRNMQAELANLVEVERLTKRTAEIKAESLKQDAAKISLLKEAEKYATNQVKLEREIAKAKAEYSSIQNPSEEITAAYATTINGLVKSLGEKDKAVSTGAKVISEAEKGLKLYNDLMAVSTGLTSNFAEQQALLAAKFAKDGNLDEYRKGLEAIIAKQPYMVAGLKAEAAGLKAEADVIKETNKARESAIKAQDKQAKTVQDALDKQLKSNAAIGLTKEALAELESSTILANAAELDRQANLTDGVMRSPEIIAGLKREAKALRDLATAKVSGAQKQAGVDAANDMLKEQKRAAEESGKYWESALMRAFESGKGFFQSLWDTIKNTLKTQVLKVFVQGVVGSVGVGAAGAAFAGGSGGAGDLLGVASNLGTLFNAVSGGLNVALQSSAQVAKLVAEGGLFAGNASVAGFAGGLAATSSMAAAKAAASAGGAQAAGLIVGSFANGLAGYSISKAISGGYKLGAVNTIAGLASAIPGVGPIAGVVGGLVNRAFGRGPTTLTSSGIRGTFSDSGFTGTNYANYQKKGGFFRGNKNWTDISAIDPATLDAWSSAFAGVKGSMTGMATTLGLATDKISAYSKAVDIAAGTTQEQLTTIFTGMADDMASAAAPSIKDFAKIGETASVTLERLSGSLSGVNKWLDTFNEAILESSLIGADAASKLIEAFGGSDAFAARQSEYYAALYSDADRLKKTAENVAKGLALVNVAMPDSIASFNAIRDALNLSTDAGRNTYAVLTALGPEFAQVAKAAEALAATNQKFQDQLDIFSGKQTERSLALRDATDESTRALMRQVFAQEDLRTAVQANLDAANNAMAALQRAVDAQRKIYQSQADAAQEAVNEIKSVFDILGGGIRTLYSQVESTQIAAAGRAFIDNALSNAQATGYLPESAALSDAVQAATNDSTVYASQAESDFAKLALAGTIGKLQKLTGGQLTTAEKQLQTAKDQLTRLDDTLAMAQKQLDAANGINTSVLSVAAALDAFNKSLMGIALSILDALKAGAIGSVDAIAGLKTTAGNPLTKDALSTVATNAGDVQVWASSGGALAVNNGAEQTIYGKDGSKFLATDAISFVNSTLATGSAADVYTAAVKTGISSASLDALMGWQAGTSNTWAVENKLPAFDVGTNYVPRDMMARIHEGEAIIPKAYNPAAGSQKNNEKLERLVEGLTKEVQRLQAIVNDGNTHNRRTADAVNGNPEAPTLVQIV